jgi:two-component system OmpR family sensor kinase
VAATLNRLLERLRAAFEAERSFAANAAHELRTPLAGAIAQAQRLRSETLDPAAKARAAEIEATLKRLTRLARAEGGRLRLDQSVELRSVARVVAEDLGRMGAPGRIALSLPETPVMSDLDPDAFGILCRNLVENALRHGVGTAPVEVTLTSDGRLVDSNDGPVLPADVLDRLTARFERAGALTDGSGLGLATVVAIADRTRSQLVLVSPRPGAASGFHASVRLPTDVPHQPRHPGAAQ